MRVAVIGRMRSGTTLFRQWLGSPDNAHDIGEVFHGLPQSPNNFWAYVHELSRRDQKFRHPQRYSLAWRHFIEEKHRENGAEILVFDLKIGYLNYVLNYDGAAYKTFCLDENTKVVRLQRRNIFRMILSVRKAERSGQWFKLAASPAPDMLEKFRRIRDLESDDSLANVKIRIDPATLSREIAQTIAQDKEIDRIFADRIDGRVTYEDLLDASETFNREVALSMAKLMGVAADAFRSTSVLARQGAKNPLDDVENAEEVARYFRGTEYQWMFEGG